MLPNLQLESMTKVLPERLISCFEQDSWPTLNFSCNSLSVAASMQCCMAGGVTCEFSSTILISHSPGLRVGRSIAAAGAGDEAAGAQGGGPRGGESSCG